MNWVAGLLKLLSLAGAATGQPPEDSMFFPAKLRGQAKAKVARYDGAAAADGTTGEKGLASCAADGGE